MTIIALDPGTYESQVLMLENGTIAHHEFVPNAKTLEYISFHGLPETTLAIEMVQSFGMPVGKEVFETCVWVGRFAQRWEDDTDQKPRLVYRKDVKLHLCGSARAKDANIRRAILDRMGPQGTKKAPGPTYGISKHAWAALAIALYCQDTICKPTSAATDGSV